MSSVFKREHLRTLTVFFGIGEDRPFYVESTPSLLLERLRHNATFFYLNYLLLTGILFCLTLIISPSAIIGMGILAVAWMWVIRASQTGALKIGGTFGLPPQDHCHASNVGVLLTFISTLKHESIHGSIFRPSSGISIPQQTATIVMAVISVFVLLYLLSSIFWWTLFTSGFFVAVHAFLRDASMHKDMEDAVAMEGDLNMGGEDAAFLNGSPMDQI